MKIVKNLKNWIPEALQSNIVINNISMTFDENSQKPSELSLTISSNKGWRIFKAGSFSLDNITGTFAISNPTGSKSAQMTLSGQSTIGSTILEASGTLSSAKSDWQFQGSLKKVQVIALIKSIAGSFGDLPMPDNIINVSINDATFNVFPTTQRFEAIGSSSIGGVSVGDIECKILPKDKKGKRLRFLVGIAPSPDFKMVALAPELKILDDFGPTNFGLILASDADRKANMDVFERIGGTSEIGRGLNFIAAYNLRAVGLYDLLKLENIMLRAVISNRMPDLMLEASLNTSIPIGDIATFKRISFYVKPATATFSMGGAMEVKIDKDILIFEATVGIDVMDQALFVEGSVTEMWNEPFGAKGLAIGNLWMKFGVSFKATPIPLPELGIAGELKVNTFEGSLMLLINSNNPTESAIDAKFSEIDLKSILENYCSRQVMNNIPTEIKNTILNISMKDARLTIVPRPMVINKISYDGGIHVKGTTSIADKRAELDVAVGYTSGIDAYAEIDKISHYPFFELKGVRGKENPSVQIVAKIGTDSKVAINGAATLLGLTRETDLLINDKGFDLYMSGKIFNAFQADLEVTGSRIKDGGSFYVAATMQQNFLADFTKHASAEIDKATKQTQNDITKAQNIITREKEKVESLEVEIKRQKGIVQAERDRDLANLRKAKAAVTAAKNEVNKIQGNIDACYRNIKKAEANITAKKKWIESGNVFEQAARGIEAAPYLTEQSAIVAGNYTAIGTLEASKETAKGVLYATQETVRGIHYIGDNVPLEADPRVSGLISSKTIAIGTMDAANYILEGGKIIGVGTLSAAKWIVENGPTNVVNVTYAKFSGKLSTTHGGTVLMHVKGTFGDKQFDKKMTFHFDTPVVDFQAFANSLLSNN